MENINYFVKRSWWLKVSLPKANSIISAFSKSVWGIFIWGSIAMVMPVLIGYLFGVSMK